MALTVTGDNPLVVTGTATSREEIYPGNVYVKFALWYKPTTIGHLVALQNARGEEITHRYCDAANESQDVPIFNRCDGIYCDDMDSGTLFIYIGKP